MRRSALSWPRVAACLAVGLSISACSIPGHDGPVESGDAVGHYCTQLSRANGDRTYAFGLNLRKEVSSEVLVESVALVGAQDAEYLGAFVIPAGKFGVGAEPFPPASVGEAWNSAISIEDQQGVPGEPVFVVLEVQVGTRGGSFTGTKMEYWFDGQRYEAEWFVGLVVAPSCEEE